MSRQEYIRRSYKRRRRGIARYMPYIILGFVIAGLLAAGGYFFLKSKNINLPTSSQPESGPVSPSGDLTEEETTVEETTTVAAVDQLLEDAQRLAAGYDYDGAIELLSSDPQIASQEQVVSAIAGYEETKSTLVRANPQEITHVFFHSLIVDTDKAFDGDDREAGYNQVMTTVDEFNKIMTSMYEKGFVLVRIHDIASEQEQEDGTKKFKAGDIMLPPGKKPFVLSVDDVCYYEYMEGDGFATRMIIGEDGRPTTEMKQADGSTVVGDFDVVPILNRFIDEHPDFSYKGAKGILAFTGYNGILGYRTAASYSESPTYEEERKQATEVADCLKADGWELASHSWGHRNMGTISMSHFKTDTDKWENEVETLTGPTDIILFPFGSDIGDWRPYEASNERLQYLQSAGFKYFCNVDSHQYWVQIGDTYMRQGRRNLDGFRMYYDMIDDTVDHLSDLFDVNQIFDKSRPTPVQPMS